MTCLRRCLIVLLSLLLLAAAALGGAAWLATDWLVRGDAPAKADAILVLSGDPLRVVYAAELFRDGLAPQVILTVERRGREREKLDELGIPFPRMENVYRDVLLKLGVPGDAIRTVGHELASTAAEALALKAAVKPGTTLLIVTSPYHTRRSRMVFEEHFPAATIRVVSDPKDSFPRKWWTDQDAARNTLLEFTKTAFFLAGGRF